ncbi:MAG: hypothetical protein AAFR45_06065 [Pseudomonadota bacterium]
MSKSTTYFLERRSYRLRRVADALRLLPLLGALLFAVPLLWPVDGNTPMPMSQAAIYVFVVWAGLIATAALLSARIETNTIQSSPDETA